MRPLCALSAIGDKGSNVFTLHSTTNIFRRETLSAPFVCLCGKFFYLSQKVEKFSTNKDKKGET
jgi:hypothetical protein